MTEEKQIEEMAQVIHDVAEAHHIIWCTELAKILYNAGYRKQINRYYVEPGKPPALIETSENKQSEGKWVYENTATCLVGTDASLDCRCTLCGRLATNPWDFCPSCGAKLKGGEE